MTSHSRQPNVRNGPRSAGGSRGLCQTRSAGAKAAVNIAEELLNTLKAALFNPELPWPDVNEIYEVERVLARLRHIDGAELVDEYTWWVTRYPGMTAAMIRTIREREQTELRALCRYLGLPDRETAAYLRKLRSAA